MRVKLEELDLDRIAAQERTGRSGLSLKFVFAIFIGAVWIVPFYYLVISIFKTTEQYSLNHPLSLPTSVAPFLDNAIDAWLTAKMGAGLLNSTLYGLVGAGLAIFFAAMAAYGLSREMDEAARMDGAREFTVFWRIVLPNCKGPLTATFLLQFTWVWNDLLFSTVLANRTETRSIMNALQVFQGSYSSTGPNVVLTATVIATVPSVVLFFLLRRHFMEGMRISSL